MIAVGNDELSEIEVKEGDIVIDRYRNLKGELQYGKDEAGCKNNILGFITVGDDSYLVSIRNRLIPGWEKL